MTTSICSCFFFLFRKCKILICYVTDYVVDHITGYWLNILVDCRHKFIEKVWKQVHFVYKGFLGMIGKGFNRHNFSNELKLPWITFNSFFFFTDVMVVVCVKIKHHTENPESKIKHSWIIVIQNKPKNSANNQDRLIPLKCRHVCLLRGSFRLACSCRTRHWTSVTVGEA